MTHLDSISKCESRCFSWLVYRIFYILIQSFAWLIDIFLSSSTFTNGCDSKKISFYCVPLFLVSFLSFVFEDFSFSFISSSSLFTPSLPINESIFVSSFVFNFFEFPSSNILPIGVHLLVVQKYCKYSHLFGISILWLNCIEKLTSILENVRINLWNIDSHSLILKLQLGCLLREQEIIAQQPKLSDKLRNQKFHEQVL